MTRAEALELLALTTEQPDQDEIMDAYELQLHPIKQYWLTNAVIPLLFSRRLEKVKKLFEALSLLDVDISDKNDTTQYPIWDTNNTDLIRSYEEGAAKYRTALGRLSLYGELKNWLEQLLNFQDHFERSLFSEIIGRFGTPENWPDGYSKELKISDGVDTVIVARGLKESGFTERNAMLSEIYKVYKRTEMVSRSGK